MLATLPGSRGLRKALAGWEGRRAAATPRKAKTHQAHGMAIPFQPWGLRREPWPVWVSTAFLWARSVWSPEISRYSAGAGLWQGRPQKCGSMLHYQLVGGLPPQTGILYAEALL